jgi:hypothetical protein
MGIKRRREHLVRLTAPYSEIEVNQAGVSENYYLFYSINQLAQPLCGPLVTQHDYYEMPEGKC